MAQNVIFPAALLLFLHIWSPCSPVAAAATIEPQRYEPYHCSSATASPARRTPCIDENSQIIDWWPDMDCSRTDSISVTYFLPNTRDIVHDLTWLEPIEVRLECHPAGGTDQLQDEALICRIDIFERIGGPFEFSNLSAVGILPGWECNINACYMDAKDEEKTFRTQVSNCTLPGTSTSTPTNSTSVSTPTSMPSTSDVTAATVGTVNATRDQSDDNVPLENYLPVLIIFTAIIMLCVVSLLGIIYNSFIRIRRHQERKRALLLYNKQSMVFDPHFYPSVCIDKPAFSRSPMMSVVSINLLQSLDLTPNEYVKEHPDYIQMNEDEQSLNFETDTDDSDAGSIDLSNPTAALKIQKLRRSNDDISSTHTEIIVKSPESVEKTCLQSDSACSIQNVISSEQGYVQLPHYEQGFVLSPTTVTKLDCSSDDNDSVLTEILSKDNQFEESTVAEGKGEIHSTSGYVQLSSVHTSCAVQQEIHSTSGHVQSGAFSTSGINSLDNDSILTGMLSTKNNQYKENVVTDANLSTSGYVGSSTLHTTCAVQQEMHSTSGYVQSSVFSMPLREGINSDNGYVECGAISIKTESKDEPTNALNLQFNDETCDDTNVHDQSLRHATMEGCHEASVYFYPSNFHSAISDRDNAISDYLQDTMTLHHHIASTNNNKSEQAYSVEKTENSHLDSPVVFHPPTVLTNNETRPDTCTSTDTSLSQRECLQPISSSRVFTNSSTKSTDNETALLHSIDTDSSTNGYLPSELFTRKILVPANHDSPAAAGFVVHLDFENGHKLVPRTINDV